MSTVAFDTVKLFFSKSSLQNKPKMDDYDGFHHVVKGCLLWEISHVSIVTTQDETYEHIPTYCSSGFYSGIGTYFLCGLLYLQGFKNVLHQYFTALSGIRNKQSGLLF